MERGLLLLFRPCNYTQWERRCVALIPCACRHGNLNKSPHTKFSAYFPRVARVGAGRRAGARAAGPRAPGRGARGGVLSVLSVVLCVVCRLCRVSLEKALRTTLRGFIPKYCLVSLSAHLLIYYCNIRQPAETSHTTLECASRRPALRTTIVTNSKSNLWLVTCDPPGPAPPADQVAITLLWR